MHSNFKCDLYFADKVCIMLRSVCFKINFYRKYKLEWLIWYSIKTLQRTDHMKQNLASLFKQTIHSLVKMVSLLETSILKQRHLNPGHWFNFQSYTLLYKRTFEKWMFHNHEMNRIQVNKNYTNTHTAMQSH